MSSVDRSMAATAAIAHKMDTELSVRRRDRAALWRLRREVHGGRVLIYFGYPKAHEYERTSRARRAGVGGGCRPTENYAPLQTRVGIATGLVVSGT